MYSKLLNVIVNGLFSNRVGVAGKTLKDVQENWKQKFHDKVFRIVKDWICNDVKNKRVSKPLLRIWDTYYESKSTNPTANDTLEQTTTKVNIQPDPKTPFYQPPLNSFGPQAVFEKAVGSALPDSLNKANADRITAQLGKYAHTSLIFEPLKVEAWMEIKPEIMRNRVDWYKFVLSPGHAVQLVRRTTFLNPHLPAEVNQDRIAAMIGYFNVCSEEASTLEAIQTVSNIWLHY